MDPMGLGRQHGAQRQSPDYVWTILESLGMKEWSQMEVVDPCIPQGMKPLKDQVPEGIYWYQKI